MSFLLVRLRKVLAVGKGKKTRKGCDHPGGSGTERGVIDGSWPM